MNTEIADPFPSNLPSEFTVNLIDDLSFPIINLDVSSVFVSEGNQQQWNFTFNQPVPQGGLAVKLDLTKENDFTTSDITYNRMGSENITSFELLTDSTNNITGALVGIAEGVTFATFVNSIVDDGFSEAIENATFTIVNDDSYYFNPLENKAEISIKDSTNPFIPFQTPNPTPLEIAVEAYIWGYSLIALRRTEGLALASNSTINQFYYLADLATPEDTGVVRPNNDTIYASAFLDLSQNPLLLSVPATGDRYFSLQFMDAYTNVIDYVGTRLTGSEAGIYAVVSEEWQGELPNNLSGIIEIPTDTVWLLGRTLVNGEADLATANSIQEQYILSYYPSIPDNDFPNVPLTGSPQNIANSGLNFYEELNYNLGFNPPPEDESSLLAQFATIGVGAGLTPTIDEETAQEAIEIAESLISAEFAQTNVKINNWTVNYSLGNFGDNYTLRAATAKFGLGANTPEEALYFSAEKDENGNLLTGEKQYRLTFTADNLIPVSPDGFWSITLYNQDGFLVENPLNRYSIGDRTEGLQYNADGSLDIYIQNQAPVGKENNWLPTPADNFNLTLRAYLPEDELLNQNYNIPSIDLVGDNDDILNSPFYRFQENSSGGYLYINQQEAETIKNNYPNFTEEGFAFNVAQQQQENLRPFYRFRNSELSGSYIYVGESEKQSISANYSAFVEEGLAFYAYDASANIADDIYRLRNTYNGAYIYVGEAEKENILQNYPTFVEEGIAFEALI